MDLIEAMTLKDIKPHLVNLHTAQTGFIRSGETGINLLHALRKLKSIQARPKTSNKYFLTFLDLKAAFDHVDHQKLLTKQRAFGISDNSINVIN